MNPYEAIRIKTNCSMWTKLIHFGKNFIYDNFRFSLTKLCVDRDAENVKKYPIILLWTPWFGAIIQDPLPCNGCVFTYDRKVMSKASAVVFHFAETRDDPSYLPWSQRTNEQKWVVKTKLPVGLLFKFYNSSSIYN